MPTPPSGPARVHTQTGSASIPIGFQGTMFWIRPGVNTMRIVAAARAPRAARAGQRHRLPGSRPSGNTRATIGRIKAYPSGHEGWTEQHEHVRDGVERVPDRHGACERIPEWHRSEDGTADEQDRSHPAAARSQSQQQPDGRVGNGHDEDAGHRAVGHGQHPGCDAVADPRRTGSRTWRPGTHRRRWPRSTSRSSPQRPARRSPRRSGASCRAPMPRPADPDADRRRAERAIHDAGDVGFEPREVDLLSKPLREGRGGSFAVVARAVESMVDEPPGRAAERAGTGRRRRAWTRPPRGSRPA